MESNTWCENLLLWFISKNSYQYLCLEYFVGLFIKRKCGFKGLGLLFFCFIVNATPWGRKSTKNIYSFQIMKIVETIPCEWTIQETRFLSGPGFKIHELTFSKWKYSTKRKYSVVLTCPLLSFRTDKQIGVREH